MVKSALELFRKEKKLYGLWTHESWKETELQKSVHETDNDAENTAGSIFQGSTFCHWKENLSVNVSK